MSVYGVSCLTYKEAWQSNHHREKKEKDGGNRPHVRPVYHTNIMNSPYERLNLVLMTDGYPHAGFVIGTFFFRSKIPGTLSRSKTNSPYSVPKRLRWIGRLQRVGTKGFSISHQNLPCLNVITGDSTEILPRFACIFSRFCQISSVLNDIP